MSPHTQQKIIPFILVGVALVACSPSVSVSTPAIPVTAAVIPYRTSTPAQIPSSDFGSEANLPTPTPATYVVAEGDTFFDIAARLGISQDALIAANPGIAPRLLTPGTILVLPQSGGTAAPVIPTPTPVALVVAEPDCYSTAAGELWCLVSVENTLSVNVENLTAAVRLLAADGKVIATLEATAPINLLARGESMPLVAYTSDPPEGWVAARSQLLTAFALDDDTNYYLPASLQAASIDLSANGLAATVQGSVEVQGGEAQTIWVLAVAYDESGNIVGFRRWESEGKTEFDFTVYSLGPEMADVKLLVEARP